MVCKGSFERVISVFLMKNFHVVERSPRMWKIGVRSSVKTNPSLLKTGSDSFTAKRSASGVSVTGLLRSRSPL